MSSYRALMQVPRMAPLFGATLLARLPIGINGIALVLFLRAEGFSFAAAGAAAGGLALGSALGAPVAARVIDGFGVRVLPLFGLAHAGGLAILIALAYADAPAALIVAGAAFTGALLPPVSSVLRAGYKHLLAGRWELLQTAFAVDSVLIEIIFIGGPLLTAALVWLVSAAAALAVAAVAVVAGSVWFLAAMPRDVVAERDAAVAGRGRDLLGALRSPGMRTLVAAMFPVGFGFGAIEVALPAFAYSAGHRHVAGVLIAIWSLGSATGGLIYGARPRRRSLLDVHLAAAAALPAGFALLIVAPSPVAMALLLIPAGVPIAPLIATRNEIAGLVAPAGTETEAYTWPLTALVSGVALGAAISGSLADGPGWRASIVAAAAAAALGAALSLVRRATLVPDSRLVAAETGAAGS